MDGVCGVKRCRQEGAILYDGRPVCNIHWRRHCDEADRFNLKKPKVWKDEHGKEE